jgi:DNA-binding NarL/FixJ family response regulator
MTLVDDHFLVRTSVASLLATWPDIEVVGEAEDGVQAVARAAELMPDLVLMDIRMSIMDGLEATRRIKAAHPSLKIVMLTMTEGGTDAVRGSQDRGGGLLPQECGPGRVPGQSYAGRLCGTLCGT